MPTKINTETSKHLCGIYTYKDSASCNIAHSSLLSETSFSLTRYQNRDMESSTAAISDLELRLRLSNRTNEEGTNPETSLTLAAEAGHLLLAETKLAIPPTNQSRTQHFNFY
ncbi:hypothetical protein J6590_084718 [Homalodisca vitripennis]|nr:hypothetical protein J6590_084718 [Homalodisca vitripennis]